MLKQCSWAMKTKGEHTENWNERESELRDKRKMMKKEAGTGRFATEQNIGKVKCQEAKEYKN